jgi:hypothetical protein
MIATEPQPAAPAGKLRWCRLTPERLVVGLLAVEGLLLLSEWFQWFAFNEHKGWTVLIAVAAVGVAGLCTLFWFAAALLFRWPFQFSIRSLLVLTVAVAIPCSWLATERRQAQRQHEICEVLRISSWDVQYDFEAPQAAEPAPAWLRKMLGDDFFANVEYIWLANRTDVELAYAGELSGLKTLAVTYARITDAGLAHLQGLTELQALYLGDTQITDAGLEYLKGMSRLKNLDLTGTKVTDAGVAELQKALPNCKIER